MPLTDERAVTAIVTHLGTAAISAALWVGMAWALARGLDRSAIWRGSAHLTSEQTGLVFALGLLLLLYWEWKTGRHEP